MSEKGNLSFSFKEKEINLVYIFWKIIYSWRAAIIWGIIFACLLSGIKFIKDLQSSNVSQEIDIETSKLSMPEEEQLKLERAIIENNAIERQLASNLQYQENSILMNIDPYNVNQILLQYFIDTHYIINLNEDIQQDYTQELLSFYSAFVKNSELIKNCAQNLTLDNEQYLTELIKVNNDVSVSGKTSFLITITGKDMAQAEVIAEVVKDAVDEYKEELSSKICSHDLMLISDREQVVQDNELAEKQAKTESTIYNLRVQQENLKAKLNSQQLQILESEQLESNGILDLTEISNLQQDVEFSIKYAILGFLVGVFLVCAVIALKYMFDSNLKTEKELQDFYNLRIFGVLGYSDSSKKAFSFVEHFLDRLRGIQRGDSNEQAELIIANMLVMCKKFYIDKIFFTTSIHLIEEERKSISYILEQMKKQGIEVVFEENMMRNIKALTQMSELGRVVLVEKVMQTRYPDLERELMLCNEQDAEVLGVIAILK